MTSAALASSLSSDATQVTADAAAGDHGAFETLVKRHWDSVRSNCYRLLGDSWAAEDATQETFLLAYRAIGRFEDRSMRGWLLRIARNACIDELRRRQRNRAVRAQGDCEEALQDVADEAPTPETVAETNEGWAQLDALIGTLPRPQQQVVVLIDVHGYRYEEAARLLDVAPGTVKSRLHRAHQAMRANLTSAA